MLYSWGIDRDKTGILGLGDIYNQPIPVVNDNFKDKRIMALSISEKHACAIDNRHQLYSWGTGLYNELGLKSITKTSVPIKVDVKSILPMSIKCGMNYTIVITYENIPFYFGVIDKDNYSNCNDNANELKSSIEQLTNYNMNNINPSDEGMKSIFFESPYKINAIYCGEHLVALIDLMGNLYFYSEKEGMNRVKIAMSVKSVKFVNRRIYALTKQSDFIYEFTSRRGGDYYNPLEEYIENLYSINKDYHSIDFIDTPYYDKALFFSLECTPLSKSKAEYKEEKIFSLVKNTNSAKDAMNTNERHLRYNSSITAYNNTDCSRMNIKLGNHSQCNIYYNSGNISPNPSTLTSHSIISRQTGESSTNKFLTVNQNRASMPDLKIKQNSISLANGIGISRIGRISNLLGHIFDTKIDDIINKSNNTSNSNYYYKGKKRIELERIYSGSGYCYTRDGIFTTENLTQYPHKRSMSQTSRDIKDSNTQRRVLRTVSQDRYMNTQEVNQILKRAKKEDEYIDSIRNYEYTGNNNSSNTKHNNNDYEVNTNLYARIIENDSKDITLFKTKEQDCNTKNNDNENSKERDRHRDSNQARLHNKEDVKIIDITSAIKKKDMINNITKGDSNIKLTKNKKAKSIKEQCKEINKQIKEEINKMKPKNISKFITKKDSNIDNINTSSLSHNEEDSKNQNKSKPNLYTISKAKDHPNYQCDEIAEKNESDRSQIYKQHNIMTMPNDQPNQKLFFFNQSQKGQYINLKDITNIYIKHSIEKEKQTNIKTISKSNSSTLIRKNEESKDKDEFPIQEQCSKMIYKKPIKSANKMTKAKTIHQDDNKSNKISNTNNQPLMLYGNYADLNYSKTPPLKLIDKNKEDDSELNEALFSSDNATNNLSTKRHSQNELSSNNNMNKRTHSDISPKRGINKEINTFHIEHIDLNDIVNKETEINNNNNNMIEEKQESYWNNAKASYSNRNIKVSAFSSMNSIASSIYQNLLSKNKTNDNQDGHSNIKESNSALKKVEYNIVQDNNSIFKRSSSMASIQTNEPNTKSKPTAIFPTPIKDNNHRNENVANSKTDKEVILSTNYNSLNKPYQFKTKNKGSEDNSINNNNNNNGNNSPYDILGQDKERLSMNKYNYSTKINTPVKLINVQQVKGSNINLMNLSKISKKGIDKRPSFASSSKPKIIEKVKKGQITKHHSKVLLSKTSRGNNYDNSLLKHENNNTVNTNGNNAFEAKDTYLLQRHKSLGRINPHYYTMTQEKKMISISDQLSHHKPRQHSHDKIAINRNNIQISNNNSIEELRDKYIKYLERIYGNDKNKIINQLLSPKGSDNELIKDFFTNEINKDDNGFINPSQILITYQDFHEDMKYYMLNNLENLKFVQAKEQMENNHYNDNQYIPEVTKTNNLITLEYDDNRINSSHYEPLELEKSVRSNIRHSIDKSKIILTTEPWLENIVNNNSNNNDDGHHYYSSQHSPKKGIIDAMKDKSLKRFLSNNNNK